MESEPIKQVSKKDQEKTLGIRIKLDISYRGFVNNAINGEV
jgi:hypothetical protein